MQYKQRLIFLYVHMEEVCLQDHLLEIPGVRISIFCYSILLIHYICLITLFTLWIVINNTKYNQQRNDDVFVIGFNFPYGCINNYELIIHNTVKFSIMSNLHLLWYLKFILMLIPENFHLRTQSVFTH